MKSKLIILVMLGILIAAGFATVRYLQIYNFVSVSESLDKYFFDDFDGDGALHGYRVNNPEALPLVVRRAGRYFAELLDNTDDKTLHYKHWQGRLDGVDVCFPFEVIVRDVGIGRIDAPLEAPAAVTDNYIFAGVQVHVEDLKERNSSHVVVGHRGEQVFTVEGKHTIDGESYVTDEGPNVVPLGRADIRIIGMPDRNLKVMWQTPTGDGKTDDWNLYNGDGLLPGQGPAYGQKVVVGLITYAQGNKGLPFVGTADSFEIRSLAQCNNREKTID